MAQKSEEHCDTFYLRFDKDCRPFNLPKYPDVVFAVRSHFNDYDVIVQQKRIDSNVFYKIDTAEPHEAKGQVVTFDIQGKEVGIELESKNGPLGTQLSRPKGNRAGNHSGNGNREKGLLITMKGCADNATKHIPNGQFDQLLANDLKLTVIKPTMLQR